MRPALIKLVLFLLTLGVSAPLEYSRLDKRIELLEDRVHFEFKTVREDLKRIFGLLNTSVVFNASRFEEKKSRSTCSSNDQCFENEIQNRFDDSMALLKHAFSDEKAWMRSHSHKMEEAVSRVKRDMYNNIDRVQDTIQALNKEITQSCKTMGDTVKNMEPKFDTSIGMTIQLKETLRMHALNGDKAFQTTNVRDEARDRELQRMKTIIQALLLSQKGQHGGIYQFGNSMYVLGLGKVNWSHATENCKLVGAHLPYVETKGEDEFLEDLDTKTNSDDYGMWLGATDKDQEGVWKWEPISQELSFSGYFGWGPNQPDNYYGTEHCLHHWKKFHAWNDLTCSRNAPYMCELELP